MERDDAAEPLYRRALLAQERILGPEHPNTLMSVHNLAVLLGMIWAQSGKVDYDAIEPLYRREFEAWERILGPEHPRTLDSLNTLAFLLIHKRDYAAAEPLYRRALEASERLLGPEHASTLSKLDNLSGHRERVLCLDFPWWYNALNLNNLAVLLDDAAAEPLFRRAVEVWEHFAGPEEEETLGSLNNLALLLSGKGDYDAAEALFRRVLRVEERSALGPDGLRCLTNLANLLSDKGPRNFFSVN